MLDGARAGDARRHHRASPTTARVLPVTDDDLVAAEVTTRDIDRGDSPHFLLKEITEAPQ